MVGKVKRCPEYWAEPYEKIVFEDEDFAIVRYPARAGGFLFEVVPITETCSRLDDWEICPEPSTFEGAKRLMEKYRPFVQSYKCKEKSGSIPSIP